MAFHFRVLADSDSGLSPASPLPLVIAAGVMIGVMVAGLGLTIWRGLQWRRRSSPPVWAELPDIVPPHQTTFDAAMIGFFGVGLLIFCHAVVVGFVLSVLPPSAKHERLSTVVAVTTQIPILCGGAFLLVAWLMASSAQPSSLDALPGESLLSPTIWKRAYLALGGSWAGASPSLPGGLPRELAPPTSTVLGAATLGIETWLIAMPPCWLASQISVQFLPVVEHSVLRELTNSASVSWQIVLVVSAVIVAPISEEVLFRGFLQGCLRSAFRRLLGQAHPTSPAEGTQAPPAHLTPPASDSPTRWLAISLTAVLFALVHFSVPHSVLPLIVLGLALGWVYESTGTLVAPIVLHAAFNMYGVGLALLDSAKP